MNDSISSLDHGEPLVRRFRASGMTRKDFAARSGISVSTRDYYVRHARLEGCTTYKLSQFPPGIDAPVPIGGATR